MDKSELEKGLDYIKTHDWKKQNTKDDKLTDFIYTAQTFDEVLQKAKENNATEAYAVHRWYNFITSKNAEKIFCEYGAVKEEDEKNHNTDFWIKGTNFDLKMSVYPKALTKAGVNLDLTRRSGKNELAKWLCENASMQRRYHIGNRIFIVCDGKDDFDNYRLKNDTEQIRQKVKRFMEYVDDKGFNQITYRDKNNQTRTILTEVIMIQ